MQNISLAYVYDVSAALEPLSVNHFGQKYSEAWFPYVNGQAVLTGLLVNSVFSTYWRTCRAAGDQLLGSLRAITDDNNMERVLGYEVTGVPFQYAQFKTVLLAEWASLPSYFVTQKGGYDTITLLGTGERLFPAGLLVKVPEALFDAREAAKGLAFEMSTAAGFHIMRTMEAVLRRYYVHVMGSQIKSRVRNIGVYILNMRKAGKGDPKVLDALEQLTRNHRNPLIHPDAVLTPDEAIALFGLAHALIVMMLAGLPIPQPTTTSASTGAFAALTAAFSPQPSAGGG